MTIQAIPTTYKGITFRSRLEARWAVFFDELNIKYFYEYEGFQLPSGWYLPDFYLPDLKVWIEVKAVRPNDREWRVARELATATNKKVFILFGDVISPADEQATADYEIGDGRAICISSRGDDSDYLWCECPVCHAIGIEYEGRYGRMPCHHDEWDKKNALSPLLLDAYRAAVEYQFTFEFAHREKPMTGDSH